MAPVGRVKPERTLILRTISNYTTPPADLPASASATQQYPNNGEPALVAAFEVGNRVVQSLVENWSQVAQRLPAPP